MKQFLGIRAKPLEFEIESDGGKYKELIARAFGWDYWIHGKADVWRMEVVFADNAFYTLDCASEDAAVKAANTHLHSHIAEWLEVAK